MCSKQDNCVSCENARFSKRCHWNVYGEKRATKYGEKAYWQKEQLCLCIRKKCQLKKNSNSRAFVKLHLHN